jgi:hypothetical protein
MRACACCLFTLLPPLRQTQPPHTPIINTTETHLEDHDARRLLPADPLRPRLVEPGDARLGVPQVRGDGHEARLWIDWVVGWVGWFKDGVSEVCVSQKIARHCSGI